MDRSSRGSGHPLGDRMTLSASVVAAGDAELDRIRATVPEPAPWRRWIGRLVVAGVSADSPTLGHRFGRMPRITSGW